jgi:hypothetical protein
MQRDANAAVVIDFATYKAARAATRGSAATSDEASTTPGSLDPDRLARLRDLTPRQVWHRARMLAHLSGRP